MKACWLLFAVAVPAWTQPKAVELFGHVGVFRGGSDEGSLGRAAGYAGALTVPLARRIALDFDVQSARLTRTWAPSGFWQSRRTLLSPSLLYRKGAEVAYFFVGGGVGGEIATSVSQEGNLVEGYTLPPRGARLAPVSLRPPSETSGARFMSGWGLSGRRPGACRYGWNSSSPTGTWASKSASATVSALR
jgi:hypothetical protein